MKKIRIPLIALGVFSLLIPLGIAAEYIIAFKTQNQPIPTPFTTATGFIPLIFGVAFIYIGIRLRKILSANPKFPILTMRAWIVSNVITGVLGLLFGRGINLFALVCVATIYWYFSWAFERAENEPA